MKAVDGVSHISDGSGMTRSGRIFAPEKLRRETNEVVVEAQKRKEVLSQDKGQEFGNQSAPKEDDEFLKIIKRSEYKIVDQLNQTPSKISILSLLLNSEAHRKALLKVLNQAHVTEDVTVDHFGEIVANITASSCLSFNDEDLPIEGKAHNKALHISTMCHDTVLARVLVDTGSSLNVLPKVTLNKMSIDEVYMKPSSLIVKAFDGSKRSVIGEVCLPVQIGPHTFNIIFQVMDINPAYSCLLGRPWIHAAGAVTSTLHQKLKFVVDDKLITVAGEEDIFVSHLSSFQYVEANEESLETALQALEVANAVAIFEKSCVKKPKVPTIFWKDDKLLAKGGGSKGCEQLWDMPMKRDKYGLGYKPSMGSNNAAKIPIGNIQETFCSTAFSDKDQVSAIEDVSDDEEIPCLVYHCSSNARLNNWTTVEIPEIFSFSK
ncbi:hypothetical protein P8452_76371 [Trifolium repens]|nr:hypothetical protein P8452_76371 [Trifolium repens]